MRSHHHHHDNQLALTFDDLWGRARPERGMVARKPERKKPVPRDPLFRIDLKDSVTDAALPKLYRRAAAEGRLYPPLAKEMGLDTGSSRCFVCGLLCWDDEQAAVCCRDRED